MRRSIDLKSTTPSAWIDAVLADFDAFLIDHASCERKASALAMSLVVKYPDRRQVIRGLIDLAEEELQHFREVYDVLDMRGLTLQKDRPDPYINALLAVSRHGRDERFIDRMLISSVVECRGAERFGILATALTDPALSSLYEGLCRSEIKHGNQFVRLLLTEIPEERVYPRLDELMAIEAEIVAGLEFRAALH